MKRVILGVVLTAAVLVVLSITAFANATKSDVVTVDTLTEPDVTAIQRGWPADIAQCAIDLIHEINIDNKTGDMWLIVLDENNMQITFARKDQTNIVVCGLKSMQEIGTGVAGSQKYSIDTPYRRR